MIDRIYNKLFAPNSLSTVTPPGDTYVLEWTEDELLRLRDVVRKGLASSAQPCWPDRSECDAMKERVRPLSREAAG